MKIAAMSWMQVEAYLERDDRAALPIGSTEQHAYLSLATDTILAERVALEAAEPLGIPVFPALAYGIAPHFRAYPGSMTLTPETFLDVVRQLLASMEESGFRRVLIVNGHGGNSATLSRAVQESAANPAIKVKLHNWWNAPATIAKVKAIDPVASHASWMESFPWTRVLGAEVPPERKPMADWARVSLMQPPEVRAQLGDGNFGGF